LSELWERWEKDSALSEEERIKRRKILSHEIQQTLIQLKKTSDGLHLSSEERDQLEKILKKYTYVVEDTGIHLSKIQKEVWLEVQKDAILSSIPLDWSDERAILSEIHHTNIRSLFSLLSLPRNDREAILAEYGSDSTEEFWWITSWIQGFKANRKVIRMIEEAWYRSDGSFWAREASIVWKFLSLTLEDNARVRPIIERFYKDMSSGLHPQITQYHEQRKWEVILSWIYTALTHIPIDSSLRSWLIRWFEDLETQKDAYSKFWKRLGYDAIDSRSKLLWVYKSDPLLIWKLYEVITIGLNASYSIEDILKWRSHTKNRLWSLHFLDQLLKSSLERLKSRWFQSWDLVSQSTLRGIGEEAMMRNLPEYSEKFRLYIESLYVNLPQDSSIWTGLSFETFVKWLKLHTSFGTDANGKTFSWVSIRYTPNLVKTEDISKIEYSGISLGWWVGSTLWFFPFFEIMSGTAEKVERLQKSEADTPKMSETMFMFMPWGGMIWRTYMQDTIMNHAGIEEKYLQIMALVASHGIDDDSITPENLRKLIIDAQIVKDIDDNILNSLIAGIKKVRAYFGLDQRDTDIIERYHILRWYVLTETEKFHKELINNDLDMRSVVWWWIGMAFHGGMAWPIGNLILTKRTETPWSHILRYTIEDGTIAERNYRTLSGIQAKNTVIGIWWITAKGKKQESDMMEWEKSVEMTWNTLEKILLPGTIDSTQYIPFATPQTLFDSPKN
jgi:hypothetical protein